jgi:hypothetical protein
MRTALVIVAAIATLALGSAAGAGSTKMYRLTAGDAAFVRGTKITCGVSKGKLATCFLQRADGEGVPRSYSVSVNDTVAAITRFVRTKAGIRSKLVVRKKQPSSQRYLQSGRAGIAAGNAFKVSAGDQLAFKGTKTYCAVSKTRTVGVSCFNLSSRGTTIVGAYTVTIDEERAGLLKVTSSEGNGRYKVVLLKKQP